MITCTSEGNVCVVIDGKQYNLSDSSTYIDFLVWITSPDSNIAFGPEDFLVDDDALPEAKDKLARYNSFLTEFVSKREDTIKEADGMESNEAREAAARDFLERLSEPLGQ